MTTTLPRVLVVDDEPNVRLVFRTTLEPAGYTVVEAENGEHALKRLQEAPPALVILDLKMPGLGGMATLRRIREAGLDVPVIIVTAHGSIPDAVEAMKLGAVDFLTKPIRPEELRAIARDVTERHTQPEDNPSQPLGRATVVIGPAVVDLSEAKRALNQRQFSHAETLLEEALALAPGSPEAHTLLGVLRESRGQDHAAFRAYHAALVADPHYRPALENLRRYCERQGLDFHNRAINPAAI
jgi:DNA-binding response OmpR family regulator